MNRLILSEVGRRDELSLFGAIGAMGDSRDREWLVREIREIRAIAENAGLDLEDLRRGVWKKKGKGKEKRSVLPGIVIALALAIFATFHPIVRETVVGTRCFLPNNYLVWEATRPISDCAFCRGVSEPVVLYNVSRETFREYAYTAGPIIVKGGVSHWRAMKEFDFDLFKSLYENTEGAYESVDEGCQYLHFESDLFTLRDVFSMSRKRARFEEGEEPWYVGWVNCHPDVLAAMRQYYTYPEFLPEDAEMPNTENIFFGYERGAVMHLDYIPRLMWQGQIKGRKIWSLAPIPECDHLCEPFQFSVEPGDAVLLDTRIWYHATRIPSGEFSLTLQSEYG